MKQIIIFCTIFIQTFAQDASFENETVGSLLLPRLHLNHLRTKTLHDLTTARLRHLLPIPRHHHHHLLLEETPHEFIEDEDDFVPNNDDTNKINMKEMMKKMFYYVKNHIRNDTVYEEEFDARNETINEEVFDRLKEIFAETVREEINKTKSALIRKRRDNDDFKHRMDHLMHTMMHNIKNYLSNDTILNHLYEKNPKLDEEILEELEPFMLHQKGVGQRDTESNEEIEPSKIDDLNDFSINNEDNFDKDVQKMIDSQTMKDENEEKSLILKKGNDRIEKSDFDEQNVEAKDFVYNEDIFDEDVQKTIDSQTMKDENEEKSDFDEQNVEAKDFVYNEDNFDEENVQKMIDSRTLKGENEEKSLILKKGNDRIEKSDLDEQNVEKMINSQILKDEELLRLKNGNDGTKKFDFDEQVEASRHKGIHTHHFSLTHGIDHHKPLKPQHFYPHPNPSQHLNTHVIVNNHNYPHYSSKYYNPLLKKSSEHDYMNSFIIYGPPNNPNHRYGNLQRFKRSVPLLKLIADPNVKLDMPKTMENIGTVAKNSFEDDKAPMFHIRNMVGSAKNVILAALRIPPQDVMIPTQYKIMDRADLKNPKKSPEIVSRFLDDSEDEKFLNTFKRMGFMLRESIKSGQETLQHMTDVAHSARKAFVTTGSATPKFFTPYVKATAIKKDKKNPEKLMLIAPRIGEVTDEESQPDPTDDYVKIGDLMDAFGVSNPEKNKVGLTRFVVHPKKPNKIQSRFGNDDNKKKDFFIVAEHIEDDKNAINSKSKSIKDMVDDLREKILNKSKKESKNSQYEKLMENLFPLKRDDNEISKKIDDDFEDIVNFDWEKFKDFKNKEKDIDSGKDESKNVDYNELYQKIINEKQ